MFLGLMISLLTFSLYDKDCCVSVMPAPVPVVQEQGVQLSDDIYWLYQCVEAENGGNSHRAKYLTACCILNRARLGWYGNSITEVIFAKHQFAVVTNGTIYGIVPSDDTILACNQAVKHCETWVIAFSHGNKHGQWAKIREVINGEYYYSE